MSKLADRLAMARALRLTKRSNPRAYRHLVKAQEAEEAMKRATHPAAVQWWTQEATWHMREATRLINEARRGR